MGDAPVSRDSLDTTVNTLRTGVKPIVFVPGIMGSRLSFDADGMAWDPDNLIAMVRWKGKTAEDKAKILDAENAARVMSEDEDKGWRTVAQTIYKDFLTALASQKFSKVQTPVYAIGYDWRQSCEDSGKYLAVKIARVLEIEKAKQVILITHSLGGLVARSAIQQKRGLAGKIAGVAHAAQPVAGAVVLYRRIFTGMLADWDGGKDLSEILGITARNFILPMRGIPSVFELLPTQQYRYLPDDLPGDTDMTKLRGPWESPSKGTVESGRAVYEKGVSKRYLDAESPPGIFDEAIHGSKKKADTKKTREMLAAGVKGADRFHEKLGLFLHPNTWTIYCTGKDTDVAVQYPVPKDAYNPQLAYRTLEGDGTVPDASAAALFAKSYEATIDNVKNANYRQFFAKGAEHAKVLDHAGVRAAIIQMIRQMVQYG